MLFGALISYLIGCAITLLLIIHTDYVQKHTAKLKLLLFGTSLRQHIRQTECNVCDAPDCKRHNASEPVREPWKGLMIDKELDKAVESLYSRILNSFVKTWLPLLSSHDEDFFQTLKQGLREATCHLIIKIQQLDCAVILTERMLPIVFDHIELIQRMLQDGTALDKLPSGFIQQNQPIHPAVINRKAEMNYLRAVAKSLIPKIFRSENFDSKIFFSLVRELIACWVLLPLMDATADPYLINLMITSIINKNSTVRKTRKKGEKVEFLNNFIFRNNMDIVIKRDDKFLDDRSQLYSFMQFLKKGGALEILSFYLDVDNLNKELHDPRITTDPAKLSSLYQQSEKLLQNYKKIIKSDITTTLFDTSSLSEAHEHIKTSLESEWRKEFHKTADYFEMVYGCRDIPFVDERKNSDHSTVVSRLGSKFKVAIRGAVDGSPLLEVNEVPTVWDALSEPHITAGNVTIYNSVAQKLRKERGQNLDAFLGVFIQSVEQSPDVGEDVAEIHEVNVKSSESRHHSPGRSSVFGNLFEFVPTSHVHLSVNLKRNVRGPTQCLLYSLDKILNAPKLVVQLIFAFVCISQKTMDLLICQLIDRLIKSGLYEPRLSVLVRLLENHLFGSKSVPVSSTELLECQREAREKMDQLHSGLGKLVDAFQSPSLNKQLMYCVFDVILEELNCIMN